MGAIIFITGGARSGKSSYAQNRAEAIPGRKLYLATCPDQKNDEEMEKRIQRHIKERRGRGWETIEEPLYLAEVISENGSAEVILVDCLTLWISNLMADSPEGTMQDEDIENICLAFIAELKKFAGTTFLVSNEVGMGIVPDNALARRFRDLAGRCNQVMASGADEAVLVSCGMPIHLKK